jgi:hypothetical protein
MQIYKDLRCNDYEIFDNEGNFIKLCKNKKELNEYLKKDSV